MSSWSVWSERLYLKNDVYVDRYIGNNVTLPAILEIFYYGLKSLMYPAHHTHKEMEPTSYMVAISKWNRPYTLFRDTVALILFPGSLQVLCFEDSLFIINDVLYNSFHDGFQYVSTS